MPLTVRYTIVCDEVRVENNGKLIVIGMYGPTITVPQIPFVFPSLSFLQLFETDRPGGFQFQGSIQHLESGQQVAQAAGMVQVPQPGFGVGIVAFRNLPMNRLGPYNFSIRYDGQEPVITQFEVSLAPPQLQIPQPRR